MTDHEIWVVTALHGATRGGHVATWVMPATLVPEFPRVAAVLSPQNATWRLIEGSGRFALNLLAEGQEELFVRFGRYSGREIDKFAGLELATSAGGLPVLTGTCGYAECEIIEMIDGGDRRIVLADVVDERADVTRVPLRKNAAFGRISAEDRAALSAKRRDDGVRDRALITKSRGEGR